MTFFQSKPNIDDHEKARIEFHLQEIAESIGWERFQFAVLSLDQLMDVQGKTPDQIAAFVGGQLKHDISNLQVQVAVESQQKCGGGG